MEITLPLRQLDSSLPACEKTQAAHLDMNPTQLSDLDLRLLRVLDALLETSSVQRAALRLGVTPSAVSHSLRELRTRFGDPLLVRNGSSLVPTPRASSIQPALRRCLIGLRDVLHQEVTFEPGRTDREFTLAASDFIAERLWRLNLLRETAPKLRFSILPVDTRLPERLAGGTLDLVLAAGAAERFLALDREMVRVRGFSDRLIGIARRGHPLVVDGQMDMDAYVSASHLFISDSGSRTGLIDAELAKFGRSRNIAVRLSMTAPTISYIEHSDLIATVPWSFAGAAVSQGRVQSFTPPVALPQGEAHLWWHERFQHDPGHAWWRAAILDALAAADRETEIEAN